MESEDKSYPFYVWNGLLTEKHRKNIGDALWLFLWCIDRTTSEVDGEGIVLGGKFLKLEEIGSGLGYHFNSISQHLKKLKNEGYLQTIRSSRGIKITVLRAKKRKPRITESCESQNLVNHNICEGESQDPVNHFGVTPTTATKSDAYKTIRLNNVPKGSGKASSRTPKKNKRQADPLTDPSPLLTLISSDNTVVIDYARDASILKKMLAREKGIGDVSPHRTVWLRWQAFRSGAADKDFRTRDRPKDIPLFKLVYQALVEKSPKNKPTYTCQNGHPGMKVGDAGKVRCTICNQWQDVGYCKREA